MWITGTPRPLSPRLTEGHLSPWQTRPAPRLYIPPGGAGLLGALVGLVLGTALVLVRLLCRSLRGRGVVALLLAGLVLGGCTDAGRTLARVRGITIDPFPGECQPAASVQAGRCIPVATKGLP